MKLVKRLWWVVVILAVAGGGLFYYQNVQAKQASAASGQASLQTAKATQGTISTNVSATGSVRSSQNAVVSWTVSGKVGQVAVKVGDLVQANQVLASLDSSSLPQTVLTAAQDLIDAQDALETLKTSKLEMAQAQQNLADAQTSLDTATSARTKLNYDRGSLGTIASAEANYQMAKANVDRLQAQYDNVSSRPETDPGRLNALSNLENAKKARDKALATVNWYKGKPSVQDISAADAALALAQANYDDALRTYNRVKGGPTQAELAAAQNKVTAAQTMLDSVNLTAPFAGTVTQVSTKPGDLVTATTTGVRIDDQSAIYVDLSVSEVDINSIQAGQAAVISFDAVPDKTYAGLVSAVGQVGVSSSGTVNYTVTIQITDADQSIKSGMTASAAIATTIHDNALLVPTKSIKTVSGKKVVYLSQNGGAQAVTVTTGMTSDTLTEILTGDLKAGDLVITNPSATTTSTKAGTSSAGLLGGLLGGGGVSGPPAGGGPGRSSGGSSSSSSSSSSTGGK
jgi:HlyD family secretion protein